jgi:hypothetical protein
MTTDGLERLSSLDILRPICENDLPSDLCPASMYGLTRWADSKTVDRPLPLEVASRSQAPGALCTSVYVPDVLRMLVADIACRVCILHVAIYGTLDATDERHRDFHVIYNPLGCYRCPGLATALPLDREARRLLSEVRFGRWPTNLWIPSPLNPSS